MKNKIELLNPKRAKIKAAIFVLAIFFAVFLIVIIFNIVMLRTSLNGLVLHIDGTLAEVSVNKDDVLLVKLDNGQTYVANCTDYSKVDWHDYVGQSVTIVIPQAQLQSENIWALGLIADNVTVIDYQKTLELQIKENKICALVFGIIGLIDVLICIALFVWRSKLPKHKEYPIDCKFCEACVVNQKLSPHNKRGRIFNFFITLFIYIDLISLLCVGIFADEFSRAALTAATISCCAFLALCAIAVFAVRKWMAKKNIEYYAACYPFDSLDISHMHIRAYLKEQLQNAIIAENDPFRYADGGNGFIVDFNSDCVILRDEDDILNESECMRENVFDELQQNDELSQDSGFICKLTYEELNFEALPFYFKPYPLAVVIKSRLKDDKSYPERLVNDLHFMLDSRLLSVFEEFDVKVENLQYILENKERLMLKNQRKAGRLS